MTERTLELNRAQVTVAPPNNSRLMVLGNNAGASDLGGPLNRQTLFTVYYEMYRRHPWIRAAIDKRASTATGSGNQLVPSTPDGDIPDSVAREWLAFQRRSAWTQLNRATYKDVDIFGEGWWWVQHTKGGRPYKAWRLNSKYVNPVLVDGVFVGVTYGQVGSQNLQAYPAVRLLHFREEDPDQDVMGLSKLHSLTETVAQDLFAMRYQRSFFENSAQTGIIFNMRNASKEEAERNRVWLEQNYTGPERAHRPIVLEGDIQVQPSVANQEDMQFVESRRMNRQEILAVLDVPESLLGVMESANRSSTREGDVSFRDALAARQSLFEEEISNRLLLDMFGWDTVLYEEKDSSKRAMLEQTKQLIELLNAGLLNRDEIRGTLGKGNIKGGDLFTVSTFNGLVPVEKIEDAFAQNATRQPFGAPPQAPQEQSNDPQDKQQREDRVGEVDPRRR